MYNQKPLLGTLPNYAHPLTPNVAAWIMNEGSGNKIYDIIGGNHGTFGAGTASPSWIAGRNGPALDFDGSDDHVNCDNDASLDITGTLTICAWVKATSFPNSFPTIIDKYKPSPTPSAGYSLLTSQSNNKVYFYIDAGASALESHSNTALSTDTWYFVVGVYDGTYIKVYIDGTQDGTPTAQNNPASNDLNAYIGKSNISGREWDGTINEGWIYNRGLSASEIWQLHIDPYCWLAQPFQAELMYAAPPVGVMSPYYYESLMAGEVI